MPAAAPRRSPKPNTYLCLRCNHIGIPKAATPGSMEVARCAKCGNALTVEPVAGELRCEACDAPLNRGVGQPVESKIRSGLCTECETAIPVGSFWE